MRIRSIKPEFWRSCDISSLAIEDRLLFIGLWSYVDDSGVGKDKLAAVTADLFADDLERDPPETFARVSRGLARLSEAGRIVRYTVSGEDFLLISNWAKHQRIDKPGKARFPTPDCEGAVIRESVARPPVTLAPGTGEQGNRGTEEQGNRNTAVAVASESAHPAFEDVWKHWPKKTEKSRSEAEYLKAVRARPQVAEEIRSFGDAYREHIEVQFVPGLAVWLRGKRWTDPLPAQKGGTQSPVRQGMSVADQLREMEAGNAG